MNTVTAIVIGAAAAGWGIWKIIDYRRGRRERQRLLAKQALLAERGIWVGALVESFERTGLIINDIPQVRITVSAELDDGRAITASANRLVDPLNASYIQSGAKASLRYDPQDPSNYEMRLGYEESPLADSAELIRRQQALQDRLNEVGLVGRATVKELSQTKIDINDEGTMIHLKVMVVPHDKVAGAPAAPFEAEFDAAVAYSRLKNYQVGQEIWVRYDPQSPATVALDLARQGGTTSTSDSTYTTV